MEYSSIEENITYSYLYYGYKIALDVEKKRTLLT